MEHTKLFISYSWSTPEHEDWVLNLAMELRESGVDVILDKWDLKEGHDAFAFMEKMVSDKNVKKVIIISDKIYAEKANDRSGGVGTETQIITSEIYQKSEQDKFVVVIPEKDENGSPFLPAYYKSRIYIDLSSDELYSHNFEQLLRWIYNRPRYRKPEIGTAPSFIEETNGKSLGTSVIYRRTADAIRNTKPYAMSSLSEYLSTFSNNLDYYRLEPSNGNDDWDESVLKVINKLTPYRNEIIEIIKLVSRYPNDNEVNDLLHGFFESLIKYLIRPNTVTRFHEWDWDYFKFFVH